MSQIKQFLLVFATLAFIFTGLQSANAQSYEDAINKFNEAQDILRDNNLAEALSAFRETARIAQQAGEEADEIRSRAERQIPNIQFTIAREHFSARRFDEAIAGFGRALEYAEQYNETNIKNNTQRALPVVHLQYGNVLYRNDDLDRAEEQYKKAIELNMNYARAYYQLGLVERKRNNLDEAIGYYDQAIQISLNVGDTEVERLAESAARDYLTFLGATAIEDGNYRRAVQLLERSLQYDMEYADTYYRLAEAHNNLAMWSEAIRFANQALRYEQGGQVARAKIHFELGVAYKNQGDTAQACSAFRSAAYGAFRAAAEHELEHELNCN
jgi:tetratricopeptide (TPR) repeat protein